MKQLRKFTSLVLALAMMIGFVAPMALYADDKLELSLKGTEGHTYQVYQIFTGDVTVDANGDEILSNIEWGSGLKSEYIKDKDAKEVAKTIKDIPALKVIRKEWGKNLSATFVATLDGSNGFSAKVDPGYYLIKDVNVPETDTHTGYIVQVTASTNVEPKTTKPEFEKKIMDVNDSTDAPLGNAITDQDDGRWKDSADYDIGDMVPFMLSSTVDKYIADYSVYNLNFKDTMSKGLKADKDSVLVKIDDKTLAKNQYEITWTGDAQNGTSFVLKLRDLKSLGATGSSSVFVFYQAEMVDGIVIGKTKENLNVAYTEFSNNQNWEADTDNGEDNDDSPMGKTPEDKVRVFTYKLLVNKIATKVTGQKDVALEGAVFKLEKLVNGNWVEKTLTVSANAEGKMSVYSIEGIDDGYYKLTEMEPPKGYNKLKDPIYFEVAASHQLDSVDPELEQLYSYKMEMDDQGNLVNTKMPNDPDTNVSVGTVDTGAGSIIRDIENNKGTVLPETGGMGTTILYVLGAILAIGAGVVLVTKKIMVSNK